jgi:hypothetical protein
MGVLFAKSARLLIFDRGLIFLRPFLNFFSFSLLKEGLVLEILSLLLWFNRRALVKNGLYSS